MVISCTEKSKDAGKREVSPFNQGDKNQWSCAVEPVLITERRKAAVKALFNHEMEEPQATATVCSDSAPGKVHQGQDPWPDLGSCCKPINSPLWSTGESLWGSARAVTITSQGKVPCGNETKPRRNRARP